MLLNLLRVEGIDPTHMLRQSFHQYQNDKELVRISFPLAGARAVLYFWSFDAFNFLFQPRLKAQLAYVEKLRTEIKVNNEALVADYYTTRKQADILRQDIRKIVNQPIYSLQFLNPGTFHSFQI